MKKKGKKLASDHDVATFWDHHDATETLDLATEKQVDLVYEPPVKSISLRLPVPLLLNIKRIAAQMDIAYQALIKVWLSEKAEEKKNSRLSSQTSSTSA